MLKTTPGSEHPNENGEVGYVTSEGFKVYEEGEEKGLREPDSGILSSNSFTSTTSTSDVLMGSTTTTPDAGEYLVFFSGDVMNSASGAVIYPSIYVGGSIVVGSQRLLYSSTVSLIGRGFCCFAKVAVNGAQAIEGRWKVTTGTAYSYNRQLVWMKVDSTGLAAKKASMMREL